MSKEEEKKPVDEKSIFEKVFGQAKSGDIQDMYAYQSAETDRKRMELEHATKQKQLTLEHETAREKSENRAKVLAVALPFFFGALAIVGLASAVCGALWQYNLGQQQIVLEAMRNGLEERVFVTYSNGQAKYETHWVSKTTPRSPAELQPTPKE